MTVVAPEKHLIQDMDPRDLIPTSNVRPTELDEEFVSSIAEHGLFQPIIATPYEDGYAVIIGNRRTAGAIKAKQLVDVIIRYDLDEAAAKLVSQLVENLHRQEMRPSEVAAAYAQLAMDLGLSEEEISKKVSKDRKEVRAALALHDMPKAAREAADAGVLDLETAQAMAEFESDPKAYKRLLKAVDDKRLAFTLKEEQRKRENATQKAELLAQLQADGVPVISKPSNLSYGSKAVGIFNLRDEEDRLFTVESHAACPGHTAYFESTSYSGTSVHYLCADPKAYGHGLPSYYPYKSPEEIAAADAVREEERLLAAERREGLSIAAEVRADFIQELCRSKKAPKGVMRYALEVLFAHGLPQAEKRAPMVLSHLGVREPGEELEITFGKRLSRIAEARQPLVVLALAATQAEDHVRKTAAPYEHADSQLVISWLEFLSTHGYQLSDPETALIAELQAQLAADAEEEDEEWEAAGDDETSEEEEPEPGETAEGDEPGEGEEQQPEAEAVKDDAASVGEEHQGDAEEADQEEDGEAVDWEEAYPEVDEPLTIAA